jgi:hypothetical protein
MWEKISTDREWATEALRQVVRDTKCEVLDLLDAIAKEGA